MKRYYIYMFIVALVTILGLGVTVGYYYYAGLDKPNESDKFRNIVTSMIEVDKDEVLYLKVKIDEINVRKTNVVKDDNIVGLASKGDIYKVTDIKKGATFYWYFIEDKLGNKGFVPSGSDTIFVETFKLKNDVELELSILKITGDPEVIPDEPTTTVPITTTTTTTTSTSGKTTTTKRTTTKTTGTQKTTNSTSRVTSKSATLHIGSKMDTICDGSCEHYLKIYAWAEEGTEPYKYVIKLYKEGKLIKQNEENTDSFTVPADPGSYTAVAELVGTTLSISMDIEVEGKA